MFYRSWAFPTEKGNLTVTETDIPDKVLFRITGGSATLTEEQFHELAALARYDGVRFTKEEADDHC